MTATPNEHGVYIEEIEVVALDLGPKATAEVYLAQDSADSRWRFGWSAKWLYGNWAGSARGPWATDAGFTDREDALMTARREIGDFLRKAAADMLISGFDPHVVNRALARIQRETDPPQLAFAL